MKRLGFIFVASLFFISIMTKLSAHELWLEQDGTNAKVYFGHFNINLRETSPGVLDNLGSMQAKLITSNAKGKVTEKKLMITKPQGDAIIISEAAPNGSSVLLQEEISKVRAAHDNPEIKSVSTRASRLFTPGSFASAKNELKFDILPTQNRGEFKVTFNGKPAEKVEVNAFIQSGWTQAGRSNKEGLVKFNFPWKGKYLLRARHTAKENGKSKEGEEYSQHMYTTTVTVLQNQGVDEVAAVPAYKR